MPTAVVSIKRSAMPDGDYSNLVPGSSYPAEAKQLGIGGTIRVKLVVGTDGKVRDAKVLTSLGHGIDEYAVQLARTIVFTPALDSDDKPVACVVIWTFQMTP